MTNATKKVDICDGECYYVALIDGTRYPYPLLFEGLSFDTSRGPFLSFSYYDDQSDRAGDLELAPGAIANVEPYNG